MKKIVLVSALIGMLVMPALIMAQNTVEEAKALLEQKNDLDAYKKAVEICLDVAGSQPENYEANWMAAKSLRFYADEAKKQQIEGWKDICKEYGKKGMGYAEKAIELDSTKVEGHFWYGCCVGTYSDGVSIITALKEGLKDKTQKGFETAYAIDKMYNEAGPVLAIGRFWSVLPWPLKDKKKALEYIEEFQQYFPDKAEGQVYLGEAYLDVKEKDKAKAVLHKAAASDENYYRDWAARLLEDL